jgi:hypothetical protein
VETVREDRDSHWIGSIQELFVGNANSQRLLREECHGERKRQ